MTLRCTIEIVPHGVEASKHKIYIIDMHNITPYQECCDYAVDLDGIRVGIIKNHNRKDGAIELVNSTLYYIKDYLKRK